MASTDASSGVVPWLLEYEAVLKRPEHLQRLGLLPNDIDHLLETLAATVEQVRLLFLRMPVLQAPNDEMILETAVNGQVDLVVTMNWRHLVLGLKQFSIPAMTLAPALRLMRQRVENFKQ